MILGDSGIMEKSKKHTSLEKEMAYSCKLCSYSRYLVMADTDEPSFKNVKYLG